MFIIASTQAGIQFNNFVLWCELFSEFPVWFILNFFEILNLPFLWLKFSSGIPEYSTI